MVGRNINIFSQPGYDNFRIEYGEIINKLVVTKGDDAIDDICNEYNSQKVPDRKRGKLTKTRISEDKKKL